MTLFAGHELLRRLEQTAFHEAQMAGARLVGEADVITPGRRARCEEADAICHAVEAEYPDAQRTCRLRACDPEALDVEEELVRANAAHDPALCGAAIRHRQAARVGPFGTGDFCRYEHGDL